MPTTPEHATTNCLNKKKLGPLQTNDRTMKTKEKKFHSLQKHMEIMFKTKQSLQYQN